MRSTRLLCRFRRRERPFPPTFLFVVVPVGVTARPGSRGALSATAATVATGTSEPASSSAGHIVRHVFVGGMNRNDRVQCPRPQNGGRSGRAPTGLSVPRFLSSNFEWGNRGGSVHGL